MNNNNYKYYIQKHLFLDKDAIFHFIEKCIIDNDLYDYCSCCTFNNNEPTSYTSSSISKINFNFEHNKKIYNSIVKKYENKHIFTKKDRIDISNMINLFCALHELNHVLQFKNFYANRNDNENQLIINQILSNTIENHSVYEKYKNYNFMEFKASMNAYLVLMELYKENDFLISRRVSRVFNSVIANLLVSSYFTPDKHVSYPRYSVIDISKSAYKEVDGTLENVILSSAVDDSPKHFIAGNKLKEDRIQKLLDLRTCKKTTKRLIKYLYK